MARGLLGGLLGFIAGVALALLLERLNRRIRTPQDAETAFALPVLAEVPEFKSRSNATVDPRRRGAAVAGGRGVPCRAVVVAVHAGRGWR